MSLKQFGINGSTVEYGNTLPFLIGWLQALREDEVENLNSMKGPKSKRWDLVDSAISLLEKAADMSEADQQ